MLSKLYINWALLREQKQWLLNQDVCPESDGLLNLIDAIQDNAVWSGEYTELEVFGELELIYDED